MKVLHVEGELVLPHAPKGSDWRFATIREHAERGRRARVVEDPTASPRGLARAELGITSTSVVTDADLDIAEHLAAYVLGELGWLQSVPEGAEVRISARGQMRCRVSAEHLDYHRSEARAWAKRQRRAGYLPLLLVIGERVRVIAIPWSSPRRAVVDLDEVRARLPQYGVRAVDRLEVL
jgi:hypothetical protein